MFLTHILIPFEGTSLFLQIVYAELLRTAFITILLFTLESETDVALACLFINELLYGTAQVAAEVAAPLSRVDEIVMLGGDGDRTTSEVTRLLSELPPAVQAVTGVDISKVRAAFRLLGGDLILRYFLCLLLLFPIEAFFANQNLFSRVEWIAVWEKHHAAF